MKTKLCLLLVLSMALLACEKKSPENIRFGLSSAIVTLDPRFATDATSSRLCRLIYDSLVRFDETFKPTAHLAMWQEETPTRYVFTLLADKKFHNGNALTAEDVVATYKSILNPATASPHRGSLSLVQNVYASDDEHVIFELSRPEPLFPGLLTIGILPKHQVEPGKTGEVQEFIGSGPFKLVGHWSDKKISLKRLRDGLEVRLETIRDPTVRALKLVNNEIDLVQGGLAPEIVAWLSDRDGITSHQYVGTTFTYLGFNLEDEYLSRPKVRRAIALAIDRKELVSHLFAGRARLATSIFVPEHWVYDKTLSEIPYDPKEARKLIEDHGFGLDKPLRLTYKTSSDLFRLRIATVIQAQLSKVGIELDIQSYDWGTFYGDIKAGRFQLYSLSWVGLKLPDMFRYVFHSESAPPNGANRGRYSSRSVDSLIESAEQLKELKERLDSYRKIQAQILIDLPYVPLWYEDHTVVARDDIDGYHVGLDGNYDALAFVQRKVNH